MKIYSCEGPLRQQPALGEVAHQVADAEFPGRCGLGRGHAIDERAQRWARDADDVALLVSEAAAWMVAVLDRCEQGPEEQREAVGILVLAHCLTNQHKRDTTKQTQPEHTIEAIA